ncbi:MAG: Lrp/AsnC family transcriptional regulator [Thermovirgaceae bacterium]
MTQIKSLDAIDKTIIDLLAENSRMSYVDIAKHVNLSRTAVKLRVESLETEGIIEKYTIIVNPVKIGRSISVYFDIEAAPDALPRMIEKFVRTEFVTDLYQMTGASRLHMHAVLSSTEELDHFVQNELYTLPGLVKVDMNIIISHLKTRKGIRV